MALGGEGQGLLRIAHHLDVCSGPKTQARAIIGAGRFDRGPDLDLKPALARQAPPDDLAPQMFDRLGVLGLGLLEHAREDRLLSVGTQLGVRSRGRILGAADGGGDGEALLEQRQDLIVDAVDFGAQGGQRLLFGGQVGHVRPDLLKVGMGHGKGLSAF